MPGIRSKATLLVGTLALGIATIPAATALAAHGPITLDGSLATGVTPDSEGDSVVSVDATLANGTASGTLVTDGRTGGVGNVSQPPTITHPLGGSTSPTGNVKFAGTGEPNSSIDLYEVGHEDEAQVVGVNARGKWKTTIGGLVPGSHESTAVTVDGSTTPAKTVRFIVA